MGAALFIAYFLVPFFRHAIFQDPTPTLPCLGNVAAYTGLGLHRLTQCRQYLLKTLFPGILGCVSLTELLNVSIPRHLERVPLYFTFVMNKKKSQK